MVSQINRMLVRSDLRFAMLLDHLGIPEVTDDEVDEALAEEAVRHPVKSPLATTGHLSTCEPTVHRRGRATPQRREEARG